MADLTGSDHVDCLSVLVQWYNAAFECSQNNRDWGRPSNSSGWGIRRLEPSKWKTV